MAPVNKTQRKVLGLDETGWIPYVKLRLTGFAGVQREGKEACSKAFVLNPKTPSLYFLLNNNH